MAVHPDRIKLSKVPAHAVENIRTLQFCMGTGDEYEVALRLCNAHVQGCRIAEGLSGGPVQDQGLRPFPGDDGQGIVGRTQIDHDDFAGWRRLLPQCPQGGTDDMAAVLVRTTAEITGSWGLHQFRCFFAIGSGIKRALRSRC